MTDVPRPEHPRPQYRRDRWINLNGVWEFAFDDTDEGLPDGLAGPFDRAILVPFAPESEASGIGDTAFHEAVWYRRSVDVPRDWDGSRILLHFQAVDHDTTVWVNGVEVGRHRGGFTPFAFDITDALDPSGFGEIVVRARDHREGPQARGKQATWEHNSHAFYTRTTGIWQTVWIEAVPSVWMQRPRFDTEADTGSVVARIPLSHPRVAGGVRVTLWDELGEVVSAVAPIDRSLEPTVRLAVPESRRRLWSPEDPHLYEVLIELLDENGRAVDRLASYLGLRTITIDGNRILLNGRPVFQRLVLDQGYWPDTLMTAPSDDALVRDIRLGMEAGFNGARVHEKVAEERYLFHADRLGYLVWGEFADWGASGQGPSHDNHKPTSSFITQWIEAVRRDVSHPSIIGWCPLNETYQVVQDRITVLDDVTAAMFWATKSIDPSRPVVDSSGYAHRVPETDIWDSHDYEQDPVKFAANHAGLAGGRPFENRHEDGSRYSLSYSGQPYMVSEFGGIWWAPEHETAAGDAQDSSWGYGQRVRDQAEFYSRFAGLVRVLDQNPAMFGYCYTQLTDVFQEQNGIYQFDRSEKFDMSRIRAAQSNDPAYERTSQVLEADLLS